MDNSSNQTGQLSRVLKSRHLNMIAIGGTIGTGLFFASGNAIAQGGPGGAMFAFALFGMVCYFLMTSLGEMATLIPTSGSFQTYASRFIDPAMGFTIGWTYWFCWALGIATEITAGSMIVKFWFPESNTTLWSMAFLVILFLLNIISARAYGEAEFWFAGIKVATVIIFLAVGLLMIVGILGGHSTGFSNWFLNDGKGNQAPFVGGIAAMLNIFLVAGWSFQGTELIGLTAGESEDPEKNLPKAIKTVFWRIFLFYIGAIAVIGFIIPFTDPSLLSAGLDNIAVSPFTLVFKNAGLAFAASLMNAVILTSVLSCGNSGLYAASRMLYAMSTEGKAPKFLSKTNKKGVPMNGIYVTTLVACTAFFSTFMGDGKLYLTLYSMSGIACFFAWLGISLSHYRFRKAYIAQGRKLEDLKYKALWYPFGPICGMILTVIVIFGANIWVFQAETFSWFDFIANYSLIPVFVIVYLSYKYINKTKIVPLMECDFSCEERESNQVID